MKRVGKNGLLCLAACILLAVGCGKVDSGSLQQLETVQEENGGQKESVGQEAAEPLKEKNELPEDGIVTQEQLASIAGKEGICEFYSTDEKSGIRYTWFYDGTKIHNAVEQRLKVGFTLDRVDEIKELADHASAGLGITLEQMQPAAPVTLKLVLPEKWDEDEVILCKMVNGSPAKMAEVEIGTEQADSETDSGQADSETGTEQADSETDAEQADSETGTEQADSESDSGQAEKREVTSLTFPVLETGDTYYLIGGNTDSSTADTSSALETVGNSDSDGSVPGSEGQGSGGQGDAQSKAASKSGSGTAKNQNKGRKNSASSGSAASGSAASGSAASGSAASDAASSGTPARAHTCQISIDCITLANHMDKLKNKEKTAFVPKDGWLLYASTVEYRPGETVYDVLYRTCREAGYQMEASYTPVYGSYYVEGIGQIYEFDGGSLSGWMYSVNGWYPNYGCSSYEVRDGDVIRWRYTLDLGKDIGGSNAAK